MIEQGSVCVGKWGPVNVVFQVSKVSKGKASSLPGSLYILNKPVCSSKFIDLVLCLPLENVSIADTEITEEYEKLFIV